MVRYQQRVGQLALEAERLEREARARRFPGLPQPGTRLRLLGTTDLYTELRPGALGTVSFLDALGTVHMRWDSGSTLGLVYGEDRWEVVRPCFTCHGEHDANASCSMPRTERG